jgi:hypothetical protein
MEAVCDFDRTCFRVIAAKRFFALALAQVSIQIGFSLGTGAGKGIKIPNAVA